MAAALADAFLAGRWHPAFLERTGRRVLGSRPPWLPVAVAAVLRAYRNPPADRPRELAAFLAALPGAGGWPLVSRHRIRVRLAVPVRVVRMRWDTPRIDDLAALAGFLGFDADELDWYADRKELNRHARDERLRHYRYTWLGRRLIEAPKPRLRAVQRRLLDDVLGRLPVHPAAHGFVPGRGPHTFAAAHAGQPVVVRLDLAAFFSTITAGRVYGLLRTAGYPEPVAHTLTALVTTRTPAAVLRNAPDWRTAALLRHPHLPQGAPTSPALANLLAYRLDRRLSGLAARFDATYTRYADDLAFSGPLTGGVAGRLVAAATTVVAAEGFRVHPGKTRIRGRADRQLLTGLVVNDRPAVPRAEYDHLRAVLHDAARNGLAAADRDGRADFAAYLRGRVAWVAHAHPSRAAKLHRLLAAALS
ncbi:reverse transcriptase family protein [Nucisporomicrobium flavum]|uniref:reverse transcriptase family protein n=1 Tax=Nucisporomicrobium flavum TaxID=2785915 RepID=UPI0018F64B29|nr:reverse transcriptase family protein [Nucisporomicrobium flavum]